MRAALPAALLLALAAAAGAHPESAAPALRPDVVAAWHEPERVEPGTPWTGHLRLDPGSPVVAAAYQVCEVGRACFAPPRAAASDGNGTWWFPSSDVTQSGRPVHFPAGMRVGVKWILAERDGNGTREVAFPAEAPDDPEASYLVFEVAPRPAASAPAPAAVGLLAALAVALPLALARAARRRHG